MAIDKTKKFWRGDGAEDIAEYLNLYSDCTIGVIKLTKCGWFCYSG